MCKQLAEHLKKLGLKVSERISGEVFAAALLSSADYVVADWGHGFAMSGSPIELRFIGHSSRIDVALFDQKELREVFSYAALTPIEAAADYLRDQVDA